MGGYSSTFGQEGDKIPHPSSRFFYHPDSGWSRDQPQSGSLFQRLREAEKRDHGNEVEFGVLPCGHLSRHQANQNEQHLSDQIEKRGSRQESEYSEWTVLCTPGVTYKPNTTLHVPRELPLVQTLQILLEWKRTIYNKYRSFVLSFFSFIINYWVVLKLLIFAAEM